MNTGQENKILDAAKEQFAAMCLARGITEPDTRALWELACTYGSLKKSGQIIRGIEELLTKIGSTSMIALTLLLFGCTEARTADRPTAERVFDTEAGYICFLVRDEAGKAVGGNCLKEER